MFYVSIYMVNIYDFFKYLRYLFFYLFVFMVFFILVFFQIDFVNFKYIVERVMLIKFKFGNDIIKYEGGDGNYQFCIIYQGYYVVWKGVFFVKIF